MTILFDTETTGLIPAHLAATPRTLDAAFPRCVQIAWVVLDEHLQPKWSETRLVKPEGFTIADDAFCAQNGQTQNFAHRYGREVKKVMEYFMYDVRQCETIVAHNIMFDMSIVTHELSRLGRFAHINQLVHRPCQCTQLDVRIANFCERPWLPRHDGRFPPEVRYGYAYAPPSLAVLHETLFGAAFDGSHDALVDVLALARCYAALIERGII